MNKLHHVGIVVDDVDRQFFLHNQVLALTSFWDGMHVASTKHIKEFHCHCTLVGQVEYIIPYSGPLLDWHLEQQRQVGVWGASPIHHVAYHVPDIRNAMKWAQSLGYSLLVEEPVEGVAGTLVNFIRPAKLGMLIELVEIEEEL
jgi:catechol 2,3-dioxygenase-like lactoylglutathione lyase family enzyme